MLLDVKDFEGDQQAGIRTLVAYLAPRWSKLAGWMLMLLSIVLVLFTTDGLGQRLFALTLAALAVCFLLYMKNERRGLAWSRIVLLSGVIATALSL